jgi:hypothetical protein
VGQTPSSARDPLAALLSRLSALMWDTTLTRNRLFQVSGQILEDLLLALLDFE